MRFRVPIHSVSKRRRRLFASDGAPYEAPPEFCDLVAIMLAAKLPVEAEVSAESPPPLPIWCVPRVVGVYAVVGRHGDSTAPRKPLVSIERSSASDER